MDTCKSLTATVLCAVLSIPSISNAAVIHSYEFSNFGNGGNDSGTLWFSDEGVFRGDGYIQADYGNFTGTINGNYYDFANLSPPGSDWSEAAYAYLYDYSNPTVVVRAFAEFTRDSERYQYDLRVYDFDEALGLGSGNVTLEIRTWNPSSQIELYNTGDVGYMHTASVVPIPASIWLFTTGLISLVSFARRNANA